MKNIVELIILCTLFVSLVQRFVSAKGITLPVLLDRFLTTSKNYGVVDRLHRMVLPQFFILDQNGKIACIKTGFSESIDLRQILIDKIGKLLN